jgi:hypothetical protein
LKILVLTSCTGEKVSDHESKLTLADFRQGPFHVARRMEELAHLLTPAEALYSGQQHLRLMRGIKHFRQTRSAAATSTTLDLWILSAGYGWVPGNQRLAPYEATFQGMGRHDLHSWAEQIGVPSDVRKLLSQPYDLALLLLGDAYLEACALDSALHLGGPTVLLCGREAAARLPGLPQLRSVPLGNAEAKSFGCGLIGLKGEIAARLLTVVESVPGLPERLLDPTTDVLSLVDDAHLGLFPFGASADQIVELPLAWKEGLDRKRLRYFIPEWDDMVDPEYDFLRDVHSSGVPDWSNEVYAHQIYEGALNYDGILVSRFVLQQNTKKERLVERHGIHRHLRVPDEVPIMGDCGAFGYIADENPKYTTDDVLSYYTKVGVTYGVSVDHIIVPEFYSQRNHRYDTTIRNAADFIQLRNRLGLPWTPIGAVQGWDPKSYADAAGTYVSEFGYRYIAIGGLVRSSTPEILAVLEAVHQAVPPDIQMHLFGLARLEAIPDFLRLGVTSIDSASVLRKAWLGSRKNYWETGGKRWWPALRIPHSTDSFRTKRLVLCGDELLPPLPSALRAYLTEQSSLSGRSVARDLTRDLILRLATLGQGCVIGTDVRTPEAFAEAFRRFRAHRLCATIEAPAALLVSVSNNSSGKNSPQPQPISVSALISTLDSAQSVVSPAECPDFRHQLLTMLKVVRADRLAAALGVSAQQLIEADRTTYESRLLHNAALTSGQLIQLERQCLEGVRSYAADSSAKCPPDELLDALTVYDVLVSTPVVEEFDPLSPKYEVSVNVEGMLVISPSDNGGGETAFPRSFDPLAINPDAFGASQLAVGHGYDARAAEYDLAITPFGTLAVGQDPLIIGNKKNANGVSRRDRLREVLQARPWEKCSCPVCGSLGVEVIIFRGNNRNRRRGFHNTHVFFHQLQLLLNETPKNGSGPMPKDTDPFQPAFDMLDLPSVRKP